jgi:hypothetical protein
VVVDKRVLRSRKRSPRVEEHVGTVKFGAPEGSGGRPLKDTNFAYPLADMQIWFLAPGANRKKTYPLADMQIWCLPNSRPFWAPKFDRFYVPPGPSPTLCDRSRYICTRSSTTTRYLLKQMLICSLRHHATSPCANCPKLLYEIPRPLSFASLPSPTYLLSSQI